MTSPEEENMQAQNSVLIYRIRLYFHVYQIVTEIYDNGHDDRNIEYEIKKNKNLQKENLVLSLLELILTKKICGS